MENKNFNLTPLFGIPLYQTIVNPAISQAELDFVKNVDYV